MNEKPNENNTGNDSDQDFDPTVDMLVNDFDDEHTLEEEEALEENSNSSEIDDLQRESEMPIEELLALYRKNIPNDNENIEDNSIVNSSSEINETEKVELNQSENTNDLNSQKTSDEINKSLSPDQLSETKKNDPLPASSNLSRLISSNDDDIYVISDEESDEDDDSSEDYWRKSIKVGLNYQATIPDLIKLNEDDSHNESLLLWDPKQLNEKIVENYLKSFLTDNVTSTENLKKDNTAIINKEDKDSKKPNQNLESNPIKSLDCKQKDDELALYILLKNEYKVKEALNNKFNIQPEDENQFTFIKPWTEEDCRLFEEGLKIYGKDFFFIHRKKLSKKNMTEVVNFYYLWKKTERHDIFIREYSFGKKKYLINQNTTDYMDHYLDEQESLVSQDVSLNNSTSPWLNNSNFSMKHIPFYSLLPPQNNLNSSTNSDIIILPKQNENLNFEVTIPHNKNESFKDINSFSNNCSQNDKNLDCKSVDSTNVSTTDNLTNNVTSSTNFPLN